MTPGTKVDRKTKEEKAIEHLHDLHSVYVFIVGLFIGPIKSSNCNEWHGIAERCTICQHFYDQVYHLLWHTVHFVTDTEQQKMSILSNAISFWGRLM